MAFFYFSDHGVALGVGNYILPSDVPNVGPAQETRLARASGASAGPAGDSRWVMENNP
jgi:hypothetical protein